MQHQTTPDFSYAAPEDGPGKKLLIRAIEKLTGQPKLRALYRAHQLSPEPGIDFWTAAVRKLALTVRIEAGAIESVPKAGPLIVCANHPYGVVDGIVACHLVGTRRNDFRILANAVLGRAPEIREWLFPIDFAETDAARRSNVESRNRARDWLKNGGVLIVFPGGTVSTAPQPFARHALDPDWQPFIAALILKAKAPVVPFFFGGQNSRLFQVASHVSQTLRLSLLFREVAEMIGDEVSVRIGEPIPPETLSDIGDRRRVAEYLRQRTYALGGRPAPPPSRKLREIAGSRTKVARRGYGFVGHGREDANRPGTED